MCLESLRDLQNVWATTTRNQSKKFNLEDRRLLINLFKATFMVSSMLCFTQKTKQSRWIPRQLVNREFKNLEI